MLSKICEFYAPHSFKLLTTDNHKNTAKNIAKDPLLHLHVDIILCHITLKRESK